MFGSSFPIYATSEKPIDKNLADAGTPIQVIADLMGHESLETTQRYVQPGHDDLAVAVEWIGGGEE
jgi:hypothetical protein